MQLSYIVFKSIKMTTFSKEIQTIVMKQFVFTEFTEF